MSAFSAAAADEDGDTISALRAENEQLRRALLRRALLLANDTLVKVYQAGAHHARAAECLRDAVIRWANRAEQAEDMLDAIGAGGVGKLEQPQVEQEPICWVTGYYGGRCTVAPRNGATVLPVGMALYTHPQPPRQPLTDRVIQELADEGVFHANVFEIVRRIEEEHGIFKLRAHEIGGEA